MSNACNNWCPEIYRSIFINRHNDNQVEVAPCCQAVTELEDADTFDFKTSPYLNQLRRDFDQGLQPRACDACWTAEEHGHKSRRQSAIEFFGDTEPDRRVELQSIDHSSTWACNLACVMCGPHYSSFWAKQKDTNNYELRLMGRLFQKENTILDRFDLGHIRKIHFNGGEPLLNNDQTDLLTRLEQQDVLKDTFISYNTNGTVMPTKRIMDLWSKSRLVKIFFSIDAVGQAFEYVRWPAQWSQVEANLLAMRQDLPGNVMFGFNTTVGSYNVFEMPQVYEWFQTNLFTNREGDASDFCWQLMQNFFSYYSSKDAPISGDIKHLPPDLKELAISQLESIPALGGIVSYLESHANYTSNLDWIRQLDDIDGMRGTNWKQSLSIADYIKESMC